MVRSVSDMSKCLTWYEKLKDFDGRYQKTLQTNSKNDATKRLSIIKKGKCCGQTEVDAIEYYESKMDALKKKIMDEEAKQNKRNIGDCFVIFKSKQISMRYRDNAYLKDRLKRT